MNFDRFMTVSTAVAVALFFTACSKRNLDQPEQERSSETPLLQVHWIGKTAIEADTNAAGLMGIWNLSDSKKVESQTLDRLSTAPWRAREGWPTNELSGTPAELSRLLRGLLADLLQNESFFQLRAGTDGGLQFALAARLDPTNAWSNNLAKVASDILSSPPKPSENGWEIRPRGTSNVLSFAHVKGGIAVSWSSSRESPLPAISRELSQPSSASNHHWLQARARFPELLRATGKDALWVSKLPNLWLSVRGDGLQVLTRAEMTFSEALPLVAEKWQMPTNSIYEPLQEFGAIQGIRTWLSNSAFWEEFTGGVPPPNQVFWWAQKGTPFLTFAAFPVDNASNALSSVGQSLPPRVNPLITNIVAGKLVHDGVQQRVFWTPFPAMQPVVEPVSGSAGEFIQIGLSPDTVRETLADLPRQLSVQTNTLYFHWETTGDRLEPGLYISQLLRLISKRQQLPFDSASISWFRGPGSRLGIASTRITMVDPRQLLLERSSSVGLTMTELQVLGDWLESPRFPLEFHSAVTKIVPRPRVKVQ